MSETQQNAVQVGEDERVEALGGIGMKAAQDASTHPLTYREKALVSAALDAVLAALPSLGYTHPRTVSTADEMDALPVGSVALDRDADAWRMAMWASHGHPGEPCPPYGCAGPTP